VCYSTFAPVRGCWPAEGAISAGTLGLLGAAASAGPPAAPRAAGSLSSPTAGGRGPLPSTPYGGRHGLSCFFRDDTLSDLIGFTYATWHGDDAAANLVEELAQLARRYESGAIMPAHRARR